MSTVTASENNRPRVNTGAPFPALPRPAQPAHVIRSDAEAIEVAKRLAREFAVES